MLAVYPACFYHDEGRYSVVFPDLNWLSTCGDTMEEAMSMAVDCLAGYLFMCEKGKEEVPAPSAINTVDLAAVAKKLEFNESIGEAFVNMVSVDVAEYAKAHFEKSVKKTLSIPAWLNQAALEKGINFSQALQEALINKVSTK